MTSREISVLITTRHMPILSKTGTIRLPVVRAEIKAVAGAAARGEHQTAGLTGKKLLKKHRFNLMNSFSVIVMNFSGSIVIMLVVQNNDRNR